MKKVLFLLCFFFTCSLQAQEKDPFMERLSALAAEGKLGEAISLCDSLITVFPGNLDYRIYKVRLLSWSGQKEYATSLLDSLLVVVPENRELRQLEIEFHFREGRYVKVLALADAYNRAGYSPEVTFRAAQAALLTGDYEKADSLSAIVQKNTPDLTQVRVFRRDLESKVYKQQFRTSYTYDAFTGPYDPWQTLSAEIGLQRKETRYTVRVNGAARFGLKGGQVELETYTKWKKGWAGFFQAGVADNALYPQWKGAFELYKVLNQRLEVSGGFTYMSFKAVPASIYTLQCGAYPGNWWVSLRGYAVPEKNALNPSVVGFARRYFRTTDEYAGLLVGYGAFIPQQLTADELNRLDAWRIGFQGQWRFAPRAYLTGLLSYSVEDYVQAENVDRYTLQAGLFYRFRL